MILERISCLTISGGNKLHQNKSSSQWWNPQIEWIDCKITTKFERCGISSSTALILDALSKVSRSEDFLLL